MRKRLAWLTAPLLHPWCLHVNTSLNLHKNLLKQIIVFKSASLHISYKEGRGIEVKRFPRIPTVFVECLFLGARLSHPPDSSQSHRPRASAAKRTPRFFPVYVQANQGSVWPFSGCIESINNASWVSTAMSTRRFGFTADSQCFCNWLEAATQYKE